MQFNPPLAEATLLKRYKRFLADVVLLNGDELTIHCPNTGSMQGCAVLGSRVWFSESNNPKRKYPNTWELVEVDGGALVGINTHRANSLVKEALENKIITPLSNYPNIKPEVKIGDSRLDFCLSDLSDDNNKCFVEVKNVTLGDDNHKAYFPDAVTTRGKKHLDELIKIKQMGHRAVLLFCVQHTGVTSVQPAHHIDPVYSDTLKKAVDLGVECLAYQAEMSPLKIALTKAIPVLV